MNHQQPGTPSGDVTAAAGATTVCSGPGMLLALTVQAPAGNVASVTAADGATVIWRCAAVASSNNTVTFPNGLIFNTSLVITTTGTNGISNASYYRGG